MRDPKRINRILKLLKEVWKKYPDLRLLQLLMNITPMDKSPYNFEDEEIERLLKFEVESDKQ